MKGLRLLISVYLFACINASAQNMVNNAGFDTSATNPNTYAQICYPTGWNTPSGYCAVVPGHGSPDYYKTGGLGGAGTPVTFWATVSPHSGAGMAGFATYYPSYLNFREYVSTVLNSPLVPGTSYEVSFWLTNGITWLNGNATNNIGVAFTTSALTQPAAGYIAVTPQVEYPTVLWDTLWHQLTFTFTATDASQYMTIGNFRTDAATIIQTKKVVAYPTSSSAYYYIDDVVVKPATPLPLQLIQFSGSAVDDKVKLNWVTANEINTSYFEIQRSQDGNIFETIGYVEAAGYSTTQLNYFFEDEQPIAGNNLYRLKLVDQDNSYGYSKCISINFDNQQQLTVFPNPANNDITIKTTAAEAAVIKISDASGKIFEIINTRTNEDGVIHADISKYPPGIYFATLISARTTISTTFIKSANR